MAWSIAPPLSVVHSTFNLSFGPNSLVVWCSCSSLHGYLRARDGKLNRSFLSHSVFDRKQALPIARSISFGKQICRAAEYKFPDPIPEFADAETEKFRTHLLSKLSKREDIYGDSVQEVVQICSEIFSKFLHSEYGGPGTLLVIPFIDMADTLNERGLPGGPQAARAAIKWATNHVDKDWNEWTGDNSN